MEIKKTFAKDSEFYGNEFTVTYDLLEVTEEPENWALAFAEKYGWDVLKDLAISKAKIAIQTKVGNLFKTHPTWTQEQIQSELDGWKLGEISRTIGRSADEVTREHLTKLRDSDPEAFAAYINQFLDNK